MLPQTPAPRAASATSGSPGPTPFSVEDRRHLLAWLDEARESGIDATEDLRLRPWPMPVTAQVIGVYRSGLTMATWLVVGQNGLWTVVSVAEGAVLATRPTLAAALAIIHSRPPPPAAPVADRPQEEAEQHVPHDDTVTTVAPN
jgi:hypothetical protein